MQTTQRNLFDSNLADVLSRDAAMERGMLLEVDAKTWVRIDRRGVVELHKTVLPEGVSTRELRISALPLLPLSVSILRDQYFVEVLYGTRSGAVRMDHVLLDAITRPEEHLRTIQDLAGRGFALAEDDWDDLAKTLRAVMRTLLAKGSWSPKSMSPMLWEARNHFLVPRAQGMRVIQGGHTGDVGRQLTLSTLRPV